MKDRDPNRKRRNKPRGWIKTKDYEIYHVDYLFSYLFEFGKEKARISYIYNNKGGGGGVLYESLRKIEELEGSTRKDHKYGLLVALGMKIGEEEALKNIEEAISNIKRVMK